MREEKNTGGVLADFSTSSPFSQFLSIKNKLGKDDVVIFDGKRVLTYSGWMKIGIFFGVSYEIKSSERVEFESGGNKNFLWRYLVRVKLPSGIYADAEGIASSDEPYLKNKSSDFVSSLAQKRAFCKALSMLVGGGEIFAEDSELYPLIYPVKESPQTKRTYSEPIKVQEEKVKEIENWEVQERKIEMEMKMYSESIEPHSADNRSLWAYSDETETTEETEFSDTELLLEESVPQRPRMVKQGVMKTETELKSGMQMKPGTRSKFSSDVSDVSAYVSDEAISGTSNKSLAVEKSIGETKKTSQDLSQPSSGPLSRRDLITLMQNLMKQLGLNTPDERREYVSKALGKNILKSSDLTEEELKTVIKKLKSELAKKKLA